MKILLLFFLIVPCWLFGQQTIRLKQSVTSLSDASKVAFTRYTTKPLPSQPVALKFGDSLQMHRYNKQRFLITDTTITHAVWFSILTGYDGANFWLVADTDYDSQFEDEQPCQVPVPAALAQAITGRKYEAPLIQFHLKAFRLNDLLIHPGFPLFVQPEFCFGTSSRNKDSLLVSPVLLSGHKATGEIEYEGDRMLLSIPLYALMSDLSLFPFYNPAHQQKTPVNLQAIKDDKPGPYLAFGNAYTVFVKRAPLPISEMKNRLHVANVNWVQKSFDVEFSELQSISMADSLISCFPLDAKNIVSGIPIALPAKDTLILYFTGSWCIPCRELTPKVETYFNQLPPGWRGLVIANEKNLEAAQKYLHEYSFHEAYYEPLSDKTTCSLKTIFNISLYPSLICLAPDGKIIWRSAVIPGQENEMVQ